MYRHWTWAEIVAYHGLIGTWKGLNCRGKQEQASHAFFILNVIMNIIRLICRRL